MPEKFPALWAIALPDARQETSAKPVVVQLLKVICRSIRAQSNQFGVAKFCLNNDSPPVAKRRWDKCSTNRFINYEDASVIGFCFCACPIQRYRPRRSCRALPAGMPLFKLRQ